MHLLHSAMACGEMEQSDLQTLEIRPVCVHVLWLNNEWKKEICCEVLGTKGHALQDLSNGMAIRAVEKSKTDISWVLPKVSIKDDPLSVPLRLNTSLHWTIWPIPRVFNVSRFHCKLQRYNSGWWSDCHHLQLFLNQYVLAIFWSSSPGRQSCSWMGVFNVVVTSFSCVFPVKMTVRTLILQVCWSSFCRSLFEGPEWSKGCCGVQLCPIHYYPWLAFLLIKGNS